MAPRDESVAASAASRKRKSRGKGLRVRTGCVRCKRRHVKCDEARPVCGACQKGGHECEYPDQLPAAPGEGDINPANSAPEPRRATEADQADLEVAFATTSEQFGSNEAQVPATEVYENALNQGQQDAVFVDDALGGAGAFETSPGSAWSGWGSVSAEAAPLKWFGLVAADAAQDDNPLPGGPLQGWTIPGQSRDVLDTDLPDGDAISRQDPPGSLVAQSVKYCSQDEIFLSACEAGLLQHFVLNISGWIDVTDSDRSFAVKVPQMALRNRGVMNAILALSARHLAVMAMPLPNSDAPQSAKTSALQYYYQTLNYLQQEMQSTAFLTSDELLATVLLVSTYEMIDGSGRGWERHLKGVFWIQRSQLIHGESEGLKQRIWWAWLRQDIWVAYREQRKILSYYNLTRECSDLGFWELVDRSVWLLGQCVNYASLREQRSGQSDLQGRVERSSSLWEKLETWRMSFSQFDRRLPTAIDDRMAFKPIWINPPAAALAVQVHHFSKILLLEHTPATSGLKELLRRRSGLQSSVEVICGIACSTFDDGASVISTMCLHGAGLHARTRAEQDQIASLLHDHRARTGWPQYSLADDLRQQWAERNDDS